MNVAAVKFETTAESASEQIGQFYKAASGSLPGAGSPLGVLRAKAMESFSARGLPNRRIEEWKYTDLRARLTQAFPPAGRDEDPLTDDELNAALGAFGGLARGSALLMVFVNGTCRTGAVDAGGGAAVMPLSRALGERPDWLFSLLGQVNRQENDPVMELNTAFMTDGVTLNLPAGAELAKPLHLLFLTRGNAPHSVAVRNVISVEAGAKATIIEQHVTLGKTPFQTNSVTELRIADGAEVEHIKLQAESAGTAHLANWMVDLGEKSSYRGVHLATGAALSRHQVFMRFNGDKARGHYYGAQLLRDRQHNDMTLVIDHDSVGCESREHVKAVLDNHARGVFQAKVIVRPDAQQTDGRQMAQSLLLSDNAEFDAKPELEIYADDVKCNHGATSGAIDGDLMFYLRARGIPEDEARALLIEAFAGEIMDHAAHEGAREALLAVMRGWLFREG